MRINVYDLMLEDKRPILVREKGINARVSLKNPEGVVRMMNTYFGLQDKAEEHVYAIGTDTKMKTISVFLVSRGTVNASLCTPREVMIRMLLSGAANMFIVHNHPSGCIKESKEDVRLSKRFDDVGKLIGIPMLDFIIVGEDKYLSFKEEEKI